MKHTVYRLYNSVGTQIYRTGIVRKTGLSNLAAKLDVMLRRRLSTAATSPIILNGLEIHFPEDGFFGAEIARSGAPEPNTTKLLRSLLKPGMAFVDVGAHIGHFSLVAASLLHTNGQVYAFEPDPITFSFLQKNVAANNYTATIFPFQQVVADTVGEATLYSGRRDRLENTIVAGAPAAGKQAHMVDCTSLDAFFAQRDWPPVQIIKIDVEGAEYQVMRGMVELSSRNRDLQIIMEFHPANIRASGVRFEQFFQALMALGFGKVAMITNELVPVAIPDEISVLLQHCRTRSLVNILCQR